jgi:NADH:ubiquinone oxidoreductase subunit K
MAANNPVELLYVFGSFTVLMLVAGFYCLIATRSFLRAVIAIELLIKAVTLFFIAVGYITAKPALTQALVITVIVVEVVVVVIAGGIAISVFRKNDSLNISLLNKLKG